LITLIACIVLASSLIAVRGTSLKLEFVLARFLVLQLRCFTVFSSARALIVYISYEVSLLPILYIIVK
jgi:NADH:ubiquinone oxidoreductase subunit 4 (subunit M)